MTRKSKDTPSMRRQQWLEQVLAVMRELFLSKGYKVPAAVRVSVGWPKGSHGRSRAIGQCWGLNASSDKHNEIFISPEITTAAGSIKVMGVLAHELAHACVGTDAGHKEPFKRCAVAVGLCGKMTSTDESTEFREWARVIIGKIGKMPAGKIDLTTRKKQGTRLLKCECAGCGYVVRITRKWLDAAGAPICPVEQEPMRCDGGDDE